MVVVFNKSDVASPEPIKRWLEDYSNLSVRDITEVYLLYRMTLKPRILTYQV
jgi:hypothetical protein